MLEIRWAGGTKRKWCSLKHSKSKKLFLSTKHARVNEKKGSALGGSQTVGDTD